MLGNPGSSPLELFWDIVDELDQQVEEQCRIVEGALGAKSFAVKEDTEWEDFENALKGDEKVHALGEKDLRHVYQIVSSSHLSTLRSCYHVRFLNHLLSPFCS